jgi:hypothetical protein
MDLFSTPIGRLAFLGSHILGLILVVIARVILSIAIKNENLILILVSLVPLVLGIVYFIVFGIFPRLASVGLSRWFTLVFFVPVVNLLFLLFLFFCPAGWLITHNKVA